MIYVCSKIIGNVHRIQIVLQNVAGIMYSRRLIAHPYKANSNIFVIFPCSYYNNITFMSISHSFGVISIEISLRFITFCTVTSVHITIMNAWLSRHSYVFTNKTPASCYFSQIGKRYNGIARIIS